MQIPMILLGAACIALAFWCYKLHGHIIDLALHIDDRENWENTTFEKHLKEIRTTGTVADSLLKSVDALEEIAYSNREGLEAVNEDIRKLTGKMKEFDDLTADSLQAQIDSEKAWAEGVRAITSYGAYVPKIDTRGITNE